VVVPAARLDAERSGGSDRLPLAGLGSVPVDGPAPGDRVALIGDSEPQVLFGLGRVTADGMIRYERRLFDAPAPLPIPVPPGVSELTRDRYTALIPAVTRFLVSVSLPIEATSPAEAVREFWSYLDSLGPAELPAFVSPAANELAMQAFVLGTEAHLDPEDD